VTQKVKNVMIWEVCETVLFGKFGEPNYLGSL
jgi:hypothetical protein